jgi:hypothetical protein
MELGSRRILHHNVTAHLTAEWTLQQFREALPGDHGYRFLIHDRDSIFSKELDEEVTCVLPNPVSVRNEQLTNWATPRGDSECYNS